MTSAGSADQPRRIVVGDIELASVERGSGPPLVLVHGLGETHRVWWREPFLDLTRSHRVIAYDARGHGETTLGEPAGTIAQLADDLRGVLVALGAEDAVPIGYSMGGVVTLAYAAKYQPPRAVVVSTSAVCNQAAVDFFQARIRLVEQGRADEVVSQLNAAVIAGATGDPARLAGLVDQRRAAVGDGRGYANGARAMCELVTGSMLTTITSISCPTLVLVGEADTFSPPRAAESIAKRIPRAAVRIIPNAAHAILWEQPAAVLERIAEFLAE